MEIKKKRIAEIIIVGLVMVCVVLILVDLSAMISTEINGLERGVVLETTSTPTQFVRPTVDPLYTPEPIIDA